MKIKIKTQEIGLKTPISIIVNLPMADRASEMMEQVTKFQITAMKAQEMNENDEMADSLEAAQATLNVTHDLRELSKKCVEFLKATLKLDAKQVQILQRHVTSHQALLSYTGYVCGRIQYPDAIPVKNEQTAPKSPSTPSESKLNN